MPDQDAHNSEEQRKSRWEERRSRWEERRSRPSSNPAWTGLFILLIGVAAFLRVNNPEFPRWIFSWQMLIIVIGLFIGFKHNFRGIAWLVLLLVGGTFLYADLNPDIEIRRYILPVILISVGLVLIFRPRHAGRCRWEQKKNRVTPRYLK